MVKEVATCDVFDKEREQKESGSVCAACLHPSIFDMLEHFTCVTCQTIVSMLDRYGVALVSRID